MYQSKDVYRLILDHVEYSEAALQSYKKVFRKYAENLQENIQLNKYVIVLDSTKLKIVWIKTRTFYKQRVSIIL